MFHETFWLTSPLLPPPVLSPHSIADQNVSHKTVCNWNVNNVLWHCSVTLQKLSSFTQLHWKKLYSKYVTVYKTRTFKVSVSVCNDFLQQQNIFSLVRKIFWHAMAIKCKEMESGGGQDGNRKWACDWTRACRRFGRHFVACLAVSPEIGQQTRHKTE